MVSVVVLVHLGSLEIVLNLGLCVQGSLPETLLVTLGTEWHDKDIPRLKICILQRQNSLGMKFIKLNLNILLY